MPQEIVQHQAGEALTFQRGDEAVPPVDISDLYEDTMKDELKSRIETVRNLLTGHEAEYPPEFQTAVEAMENYVKIKYIVTTDTTEMEMAFLDRFLKVMRRSFEALGKTGISYEDSIVKGLLDIMYDIQAMGRGGLRDKDNPERISDAEFAAAKEQKAIYNKYSGDDLEESNVKDIPLFLHRPNINDIKQGYLGDCYFLAAVSAYMRSNPEGIMNMFYDLGDGNVLVRLYMGFDENNRRVDTLEEMSDPKVTMRPVYIKVRKDYDISATAQDCMWVQLLEKAYASTGTQHGIAGVDAETGELKNLACEIAIGTPLKVMMHLTGRKDCWDNVKEEPEDAPFVQNAAAEIDNRRMRQFLSGIPLWMHYPIWDSIQKDPDENLKSEDEWINTTLETVRNKVREANEIRIETFANVKKAVLKDFKNITEKDLETVKARIDELYALDPDAAAAQVMKNILTESPPMDEGTDLLEPSAVITRIYDQLLEGGSVEQILAGIGDKSKYYSELRKREGESAGKFEERIEAMDIYAKNRNKVMMEMNPGGYYSREEMIFLHDVRTARKKGEGMAFAVNYHAMDLLDVKLKNNRWYLLVRDTNNTKNIVYERDGEGNLKDSSREGGFKIKREIRSLNGNLEMGVLGTSWWDLKDVFEPMLFYTNAPRVEKNDRKKGLLGL